MDPNQRTSGALLDRANANIVQLLRRFENIIAYSADEKNDELSAAVGVYQMEVETAALIKAAEDVLSLTRVLKETWLFGKLQTVGTSEAEERTEAARKRVAEVFAQKQKGAEGEVGDATEKTTGGPNDKTAGEDFMQLS